MKDKVNVSVKASSPEELDELLDKMTPEQIAAIRESCKINVAVLDCIAANIKEGMSTGQIDRMVHEITTDMGGVPAPLGFEGFPKSVCTSVNNQVCHGIPSEELILQDGDIINVDVSTILDGYYSDASRMFAIGNVDERAQKITARHSGVCGAGSERSASMGPSGRYCACHQLPRPGKRLFCS